jgi:plastocyanin
MKNSNSKAIDRYQGRPWQRIRLALSAGLLTVLVAGLSACASPASGAPPAQTTETAPPTEATAPAASPTEATGQVQIVMRNVAFMPKEITVPVGTTVVWTNQDSFEHTVTSGTRGNPSGLFDTRVAAGGSFSFTFDKAGTYSYYCSIHSGMNGTVVVKEGAALPTQPQPTAQPQSGASSGGSY